MLKYASLIMKTHNTGFFHVDKIGSLVGQISYELVNSDRVNNPEKEASGYKSYSFPYERDMASFEKALNKTVIEAKGFGAKVITFKTNSSFSEEDIEKKLDLKIEESINHNNQPIIFQSSIIPILKSPKLMKKLVNSGVPYYTTYSGDKLHLIVEAMNGLIEEQKKLTIGSLKSQKADDHAIKINNEFLATKEDLVKKGIKPSSINMARALDENEIPPYPGKNSKNWNFNMVLRHQKRAKELGLIRPE